MAPCYFNRAADTFIAYRTIIKPWKHFPRHGNQATIRIVCHGESLPILWRDAHDDFDMPRRERHMSVDAIGGSCRLAERDERYAENRQHRRPTLKLNMTAV